ncbi:hypothetical protein BC826DRAFT_1189933 [Russula brevipes]|nr:hypothetical protein BC826DRAFT_1189933 [Russula brevipes]
MSSDSRAQKSVQSPVAVPANIIGGECVLPRATRTDGLSVDLQMVERLTHFQESRRFVYVFCAKPPTIAADCCDVAVTVHSLPDIALWCMCAQGGEVSCLNPRAA